MIICKEPFVCSINLKPSIACGNINYTYLEKDILFYNVKAYCTKVSKRIMHYQKTVMLCHIVSGIFKLDSFLNFFKKQDSLTI